MEMPKKCPECGRVFTSEEGYCDQYCSEYCADAVFQDSMPDRLHDERVEYDLCML
jgi:hypothetical protein